MFFAVFDKFLFPRFHYDPLAFSRVFRQNKFYYLCIYSPEIRIHAP